MSLKGNDEVEVNSHLICLSECLSAHADGIVKPRQKVIDTVKKPEMFDKVRTQHSHLKHSLVCRRLS